MVSAKHIVTVFSIVVLALAGGVILLLNGTKLGWQGLSVPTGSMRPAIPAGSLLLVHRVSIESLKVGDIITYANPAHPKQTISHRIVKTYLINAKVPGFVTKGDANKVEDAPISGGSVEGKVVVHLPHLGSFVTWSRTPWGLLPLIWIPALFIEIEQVQNLAAYLRSIQPYRALGYKPHRQVSGIRPRSSRAPAAAAAAGFVVVGLFVWQPAWALLQSNPVKLADNQLSVAAKPAGGSCSSNTNVNISNSSSQSATTGSASSSGNTSGGSAASGSATNSNNTSVNVSLSGC